MSRLRTPTCRVFLLEKPIRRLLGTAALCLAMVAGAGTATADDPPKPPAKKGNPPARGSSTRVTGTTSGRPKVKPKPPTGSRSRRRDPRRKTPRKTPSRPATTDPHDKTGAVESGDTRESLEIDIDAEYEQMR